MTRPLLLASTSPYRRALLARLDIPFDVASPAFDERLYDHRFDEVGEEAYAVELALGKAKSLAKSWPEHLILAADQVALLPGPPKEQLHKPGTEQRAIAQLMRLAGKIHWLVTGVVLFDSASGQAQTSVDRQELVMRSFSTDEAEAYVRAHQPVDCVGGYRIEDAGIRFFESVRGEDYTGIIGLPLLAVCRLLRDVGVMR